MRAFGEDMINFMSDCIPGDTVVESDNQGTISVKDRRGRGWINFYGPHCMDSGPPIILVWRAEVQPTEMEY